MKEIVGREIAQRLKGGETIGLGTGSTVDAAIAAIRARVEQEHLSVRVVPTSFQSARSAREAGLEVLHPSYPDMIDWGFDGADEVNDRLWLIKGKGGAMLQEKILAARCREFIVIVDESKLVERLGERCAIPLEVIPNALSHVRRTLSVMGALEAEVRQAVKKHGPVITEAGNIIVDVRFALVTESLERDLKTIVGVVESGLFIGFATEVWIAGKDGVSKLRRKTS